MPNRIDRPVQHVGKNERQKRILREAAGKFLAKNHVIFSFYETEIQTQLFPADRARHSKFQSSKR